MADLRVIGTGGVMGIVEPGVTADLATIDRLLTMAEEAHAAPGWCMAVLLSEDNVTAYWQAVNPSGMPYRLDNVEGFRLHCVLDTERVAGPDHMAPAAVICIQQLQVVLAARPKGASHG